MNHANIHEIEGGHRRMASAVVRALCITLCAVCHELVERNRVGLVVEDAELQCDGAVVFVDLEEG
jgi:hypothetical protein